MAGGKGRKLDGMKEKGRNRGQKVRSGGEEDLKMTVNSLVFLQNVLSLHPKIDKEKEKIRII
jgi:hypothetical protein